jgi:hypothetical protein
MIVAPGIAVSGDQYAMDAFVTIWFHRIAFPIIPIALIIAGITIANRIQAIKRIPIN